MAAEVQAALTDYPAANERLCTNRSDPWVEDIETAYAALQQGTVVAEPDALRLWDGQTGHSIQALTRQEAFWTRPDLLKAIVVDRWVSGNAFGCKLGQTVAAHIPDLGGAQWHGTGSADPTNLLPSSTLVAFMHRHLLFLQPHVGNQRVYLDADSSGADQL